MPWTLNWQYLIGWEHRLWRAILLPLLILPQAASAQPSLTALPIRSAELELSLGAFDDPVLAFSRISDLAVDADGRLYVAQPIEGQVTVLNPDGSLHRRIGRKGQGPGEFLSPAAIGWRADTLWVMDVAQQRVSWFYDGNHISTSRFASVNLVRGGRIAAQWPMADGSFVTVVSKQFEQSAGHPDNYLPIIRSTPDGRQRTIAVLRESFPYRLVIQHSEGTAHGSPLFTDFPLHATSDSGDWMAIVDRPFAEGGEAPVRLTVLEAAGDTAYSQEYMVEVLDLTDTQWDQRLREALAGVDRPNRPYGIREVEEASRRPHHWPSATRVVVGMNRFIWIALADLPFRAERDWVMIDADGSPLFKVALPRDFQLTAADENRLWGIWTDEYGVPYVQRYRLGEMMDR